MSQINSLSSFQQRYADPALEFPFGSDADPVLLPITTPSTDSLLGEVPATISENLAIQTESLTITDVLTSGSLQDAPTTQSLITALQSTMGPAVTRTPVVIPGSRRRELAKKRAASVKSMHPHLRLGIVLGVMVAVVITALVSLTPLGGGQGSPTLVSSAFDWMQTQQQSDNIAGHVFVTLAQANQDNPVAPSTSTTVNQTTLPPVTLSTSAYVSIARQDALAAGINPDYFVRQIQIESGFNPVAYSPAGAVGIAQFEPSTAAALGVNPYDPQSALAGAARYMAGFASQYGGDYAKALAAYNAGSGTVQYAVAAGGANWMNFLPAETQQYILRIIG